MAYNAIAHDENDDRYDSDHFSSPAASPPLPPKHASSQFQSLSIDSAAPASSALYLDQHEHDYYGQTAESRTGTALPSLTGKLQSIVSKASKSSGKSYDMLEGDEYAHGQAGVVDDALASSPASPSRPLSKDDADKLSVQRRRPNDNKLDATIESVSASPTDSDRNETIAKSKPIPAPPLVVPQPIRSASTRSPKMRHPTPDLHTLQGAYVSNIEHLEKTAEKLSMTSSIDDAIRQLHQEQKRADSRRSSMLSSPMEAPLARQFSNPNPLVDMNNTARSGGYSPGGFNMVSPRHSLSGRGRSSSSKGSRFGSRPEPELEGRPLDSFVLPPLSFPNSSPVLSRSASIAEQDEGSPTLTNPVIEATQAHKSVPAGEVARRASCDTLDQAEGMFEDFDGEHYTPGARGDVIGSRPSVLSSATRGRDTSNGSQSGVSDRMSTMMRTTIARPTTYADPSTGQQMVYYPAPVPMMLNLPQKLSKRPASSVIDQRRTQILSILPPAARQSAVWLPDVLEDEGDTEQEPEHGHGQRESRYQPAQPDRQSIAAHEPVAPQLRATAFFEQPSISEVVHIKEDSAVATLDSILDASAYAPVNAFTDHAFAGHLGAEVYGRANKRATRTMSSTNLLGGRRSSSGALLDGDETVDRRSRTMSTMLGLKKFGLKSDMGDDEIHGMSMPSHNRHREEDSDEDSEPDLIKEGQFEDEVYHGPPTTLLAELQLRKQQNKARIRPNMALGGMHTTLMEREAVAAIASKNRKKGRVNLAWEDPNQIALETQVSDDEDVPLGVLFQPKNKTRDANQPMGLMEIRDMEDNEPLSRRRDRITGRPPSHMPNINAMRASTMALPVTVSNNMSDETLTAHNDLHKPEEIDVNGLGATLRPVSGDFASEMMSQLGMEDTGASNAQRDSKGKAIDLFKPSSPGLEEEETLGQRRKRLQAEKEARALEVGAGGIAAGSGRITPGFGRSVTPEMRPTIRTRRSMADILAAHPSAGADEIGSRSKAHRVGSTGLLGMHEQIKAERASTMLGIGREAAMSRDVGGSGLKEHRMRGASGEKSYGVQQQTQAGYGLGDYAQQQLMMPQSYAGMTTPGSQYPSASQARNPMSVYGSQMNLPGSQFGSQMYLPQSQSQMNLPQMGGGGMAMAGGIYGVQNPMAQSMLQLQLQMDQMRALMDGRQMGGGLGLGHGQADMVERWREGVRP